MYLNLFQQVKGSQRAQHREGTERGGKGHRAVLGRPPEAAPAPHPLAEAWHAHVGQARQSGVAHNASRAQQRRQDTGRQPPRPRAQAQDAAREAGDEHCVQHNETACA
jgi:hypothetical protein